MKSSVKSGHKSQSCLEEPAMVAHLTSEANVLLEFCSEGARVGVLRSFVSYKSSRHLPGSILHRSTSFWSLLDGEM